jgi:hypothetical protein
VIVLERETYPGRFRPVSPVEEREVAPGRYTSLSAPKYTDRLVVSFLNRLNL